MSTTRYTLLAGENESVYQVSVEANDVHVAVDGGPSEPIDATFVGSDGVHLLVDGRSHDVTYRIDGNQVTCVVMGQHFSFDVYDDRALRRLRQEQASQGAASPEIQSPMSGKIIAIPAALGATVAAGDPLIVIEAMKMENLIRSPHDGVVEAVDVAPGDAVENGARLMVVRPAANDEEG